MGRNETWTYLCDSARSTIYRSLVRLNSGFGLIMCYTQYCTLLCIKSTWMMRFNDALLLIANDDILADLPWDLLIALWRNNEKKNCKTKVMQLTICRQSESAKMPLLKSPIQRMIPQTPDSKAICLRHTIYN